MAKKIGLIVTHASDDPEMTTLPFILATGAIAMGVEPVVILQREGVRLAVAGGAEAAVAEGMTPLPDLVDAVLGAGYRIMVCAPCLAMREIPEADLLEGFYLGGAAVIVQEMLECENFLRY